MSTAKPIQEKQYHCDEPWTGLFSINVNGDVVFCPCYAKLRIGNIRQDNLNEVWNCGTMAEIRTLFSEGKLPECCSGQLCPPVVGEHGAAK